MGLPLSPRAGNDPDPIARPQRGVARVAMALAAADLEHDDLASRQGPASSCSGKPLGRRSFFLASASDPVLPAKPEPTQGQVAWSAVRAAIDGLFQRLADQEVDRFGPKSGHHALACPWPFRDFHPEFQFKQVFTWYLLDRVEPLTGKTPLRLFAERSVADPSLRAELLKLEHPRWSEHIVREVSADHLVVEEAGSAVVRAATVSRPVLEQCRPGTRIKGALHPEADRWRLNGILHITEDPEAAARRAGLITPSMVDAFMQQHERRAAASAESMVVSEHATLESMVRKFPSQWVDGISLRLGLGRGGRKAEKAVRIADHLASGGVLSVVEGLPEDARSALAFLMDRGGLVRLGELRKRFAVDVGLFWAERPPTSGVGRLRVSGLVVVGRVRGSGARMSRVALVPNELHASVMAALASVDRAHGAAGADPPA